MRTSAGQGRTASSTSDTLDDRLTSIASLGEPVRRELYRYVVSQPGPVNREQAAKGVGVAHHTAKFHLDKLVEDELLQVEHRRPAGRGGPGAGRPAKFYRRSARELTVSLPERRYDLAGRVLARAVSDAAHDQIPVGDALRQAARHTGRSAGQQARRGAGRRPGRRALFAAAGEVLRAWGYEPRLEAQSGTLANCPFHALAQEYTDLVCTMNLDLMRGLLDGLELTDLGVRLEPAPGRCCVLFGDHPSRARATAASDGKARP